MNIVLQDKKGRAAGHIQLDKTGGALYLRQRGSGEGVLLSKKGERWDLFSPCPFAPAGAVVVEKGRILYTGLAPGQGGRVEELEALYLHPPKEEEKVQKEQTLLEKEEEGVEEGAEEIPESPPEEDFTEPASSKEDSVEEAQAAAAVFGALTEEAGEFFSLLEQGFPKASSGPMGGDKWMEQTARLLSNIKKEPPGDSQKTSAPIENPFPYAFPGAVFRRVWGQEVLEHLEGTWKQGNKLYKLTAVPGAPACRPPRHLGGFTRYVRTGRGGYWVKLSPLS